MIQLFGRDLSLFTICMAAREASDIVDGFLKMAKGARYLSTDTMNAMASDITEGIVVQTLNRHLQQADMDPVKADENLLSDGVSALDLWCERVPQSMQKAYYSYLSHWDLEGHSWTEEQPEPFGQFSMMHAAA